MRPSKSGLHDGGLLCSNKTMKEAFFKLHLAVLIAGSTGLFGKLITLSEFPLSLYRMLFAATMFWIFMAFTGKVHRIPVRNVVKMLGVGMLLALHWMFFYGSIKYANISIGVVCYSMVGFFTAIFEPIILRRKLSLRELLFSLLTVAGIYLIFQFDSRYRFGITLGMISTALGALYTISNKVVSVSTGHKSSTILLYAMTGGTIGMFILLPLFIHLFPTERLLPSHQDFMWLLVLSSVSTIALYLLQIQVLKVISAFTVNLTFNLEPIYSIIMAMLFFGEAKLLNAAFYFGLFLIFLSVMLQTMFVVRQSKH